MSDHTITVTGPATIHVTPSFRAAWRIGFAMTLGAACAGSLMLAVASAVIRLVRWLA